VASAASSLMPCASFLFIKTRRRLFGWNWEEISIQGYILI
jgi:hypothetical protein